MAYCVQTDLEIAVGGAAVLVQLLDKDGDGVADTAQVTACLSRATAEINSSIAIAVDIASLSAPYDDMLVYATSRVAAYHAWLQGGDGQVVPENIRMAYEDARDWATRVATRKASLGGTTRRATSQLLGQQVYASTEAWDSTDGPRRRLRGLW